MKYLIFTILISPLVFLVACSSGRGGGFSLDRSVASREVSECSAFFNKKKYDKAIKCYQAYKSASFGRSGEVTASLAIADSYFFKKEYLIAAESYQDFIKHYPYDDKVPYAYYKMGESYFLDTPKAIDRDQTHLKVAIDALETVLRFYGSTPYAGLAKEVHNRARTKLAHKNYYVGRFYFRTGEYLAAIPRFQTVVTDYPQLGFDEKSFYYLIRALKKTEQTEMAQRFLEIFETHFSTSPYVKKARAVF